MLVKRKKQNENHLTMDLKSLLGKVNKNRPRIKLVIDDQNHSFSNDEKQKEINKEIIRRLRIQNKKLLEQVIKLKEEIKKARFSKNQVLSHINELLKLINRWYAMLFNS